MMWKDPDLPFWVFNCGDPLDAALSYNEWAESVGSWLNVIFSMAVRRLCCSFECNCLVPLASGSEWFNAGFNSDYLCWILTSSRRGWPHTHTVTVHLATLSILAATCFINQTNLEVIKCPHQRHMHGDIHRTHPCSTCTGAQEQVENWGGSSQAKRKPRANPALELMPPG